MRCIYCMQGSPQKKITARRRLCLLNMKWVAGGNPGESMRGDSLSLGGFGGPPPKRFFTDCVC